jgi:hypothetical protein
MANWPRVDLSGAAGTSGFAAGTLRAAVNSYGLIELFVSDYSGNIWHAAQFRRLIVGPGGPSGSHRGTITLWGAWTNLGLPVPYSNSAGGGQVIRSAFAVASNDDGRLEVIAVGADGNPYHLFELPVSRGVLNTSGILQWSAWSAMTPARIPLGPSLFIENCWPAAATLDGWIVVCYFDFGGQSLFYDYQVSDPGQVGGVGWASVANKGLFSIPLPAPPNQNFFTISLVPTAGGLSLLALSMLWGIGAAGYYVADLATPSVAWSPWQAVPAALIVNSYPRVFPNDANPICVSGSAGYLPGGGAALFFADSLQALTILRQVLSQAKAGAPFTQVTWNQAYDSQLPPGSLRGQVLGVSVTEDRLADANDPSNLHQAAFFGSPDGLSLLTLAYQTPATAPTPGPGSSTIWPSNYSASASPATLDDGSGGAFTSLDQVVAITLQNGPIQVFAVTDGTTNVYSWTEPA